MDLTGISNADGQTVQGQWLTRSYLEAYTAHHEGKFFDKAMMFCIRDEDPATFGFNTFLNSGLVGLHFQPKKSWYHVLTLKNVLKGRRLYYNPNSNNPSPFDDMGATIEDAGSNPVRFYRFTNGDGKDIFALWSPTQNGTTFTATLNVGDPSGPPS